jgi:solute:Na+ symporter, SSS family
MEKLHLNAIDLTIFAAYMVITVIVGFWVARGKRNKPSQYFLGDKAMPWFVVGASMVSTNISSEHFIANVGAGYTYGLVPATGSWNTWIIYTLLIFVFLPYYIRSGIYTMPQFLEKRFNSTCRYIFAVSLVVSYVLAIIGGSLYSGGVTMKALFDMPIGWGIVFFAVVTGAYTIWGGLASAAWTDFLQMIVLLCAGIMVPILGLIKVGGIGTLIAAHPEHFQVFQPIDHPVFPTSGILTGFLTVGIWYSCASQHMVQRVLSAKDEWHARTGVVCAGFLHLISPLFFVIPGIIAFHLYKGQLSRPDESYLILVKDLVPTGLRGLILAGIAAALMSTVSAVLNSASTVITVDLYKKLRERGAREQRGFPVISGVADRTVHSSAAPGPATVDEMDSDASSVVSNREQVIVGQISGIVVLICGMVMAFILARSSRSLFVNLQDIFFYIAPPFAVIFTLGLIWRRANATGALTTIILGFLFTWFVQNIVLPKFVPGYPMLSLLKNYYHRALLAWLFCMPVMIIASLLSDPPPPEKTNGIIWTRDYVNLPAELRRRYRGLKDFRIWWALFVLCVLSLYGLFLWHRLQHPVDMIHGA